jgi:hypothetical protein
MNLILVNLIKFTKVKTMYEFIFGLSIVICYNSYIEIKEMKPPIIVYKNYKDFTDIEYIEEPISVFDVVEYIFNNTLKKIIKL